MFRVPVATNEPAPDPIAMSRLPPSGGTAIQPPRLARLELGAPASRRHPAAGVPEPPVAVPPEPALATAPPLTEPMVIKLVSEEADLVIYWLVNPTTDTTKEKKDEISAV